VIQTQTEYRNVVVNDHFYKYLENQSRYLVLYGGAGSGKSIFASQKIITRTTTEPGHRFLCLRKVGKTVKDSIFAEFKSRIYELDLDNQFIINKSEHKFTHIYTGNEILCTGLDEPEKIKSIANITGMWLEESTEFTSEDFDQLKLRIRGEKKNYVQFMLTFNPISEDHWLKKWIDSRPENLTFDVSNYKCNQFIDQDYIDVLESFKTSNTLYYDVYVDAKWGSIDKTNKFLFLWNQEHIKDTEYEHLPLWLSFDFNVNPMTCIVGQRIDEKTINVLDQIRMNDSSIYSVTDYIKAKYSNYNWIVTGDATGKNRSGTTRDKKSYWQIIKYELKLSDNQIKIRTVNLDHITSRILCNAVLEHQNINIHSRCIDLINDCRYAKIDDKQKIVKTSDNGNHFLDCFRYLLDANFPNVFKLK
jgi:phage terminase large subunit